LVFRFRDLEGNQIITSMTTNYLSISVTNIQSNHNYIIKIWEDEAVHEFFELVMLERYHAT
jgi:hypothetical protein